MKKSRAFLLALSSVMLASCGGGSDTSDSYRGELRGGAQTVVTLSTAQIDTAGAQSGLQTLSGLARCDVRVLALDYGTPGPRGERSNSSGVLLLPEGSDPACNGTPPLVAMGKGTEVNKFATLADPNNRYTALMIAMFAAQGYAVVSSDMLGYARSEFPFHPYLHAETAATTTIDSIRAARSAAKELGVSFSERLFLGGYSQGGHTAAATQRVIERELGREFNVVGNALESAPIDIAAAVQNPYAIIGYQDFATMLITGYQKIYGNVYTHPQDAFRPPYASNIEELLPAADYALLLASGALPLTPDPELTRSLLMQPDYVAAVRDSPDHPLVQVAARNSMIDWIPQAPTLVCYGSDDLTVPPELHSLRLKQAFETRGVANANFVDVDPLVRQIFGTEDAPPADPEALAVYLGSYHDFFVPPLCMAAARQFFNQLR